MSTPDLRHWTKASEISNNKDIGRRIHDQAMVWVGNQRTKARSPGHKRRATTTLTAVSSSAAGNEPWRKAGPVRGTNATNTSNGIRITMSSSRLRATAASPVPAGVWQTLFSIATKISSPILAGSRSTTMLRTAVTISKGVNRVLGKSALASTSRR